MSVMRLRHSQRVGEIPLKLTYGINCISTGLVCHAALICGVDNVYANGIAIKVVLYLFYFRDRRKFQS